MDQNQTPSFEIPKTPEALIPSATSGDVDPNLALEGTREVLPQPVAQPTLTTTPPVIPQPIYQEPATQSQAMVATHSDAHLIADDVDVIEKEWVERAKKIIGLTSQDPYLEARELNKLKNTYMKKRFNKDLPAMPGDK